MGRKKIKRRFGKLAMAGKDFDLADEVAYIRRRAAERDGRWVEVGPLAFFSTETGDAWILDPVDRLAARLARDGVSEDLYFEDSETRFAIEWKGAYSVEGDVFVFTERDTGRVLSVFGYPTHRIATLGRNIC